METTVYPLVFNWSVLFSIIIAALIGALTTTIVLAIQIHARDIAADDLRKNNRKMLKLITRMDTWMWSSRQGYSPMIMDMTYDAIHEDVLSLTKEIE